MLRRSAPALLGLLVCLFAAHLVIASAALGVDESRITVSLDGADVPKVGYAPVTITRYEPQERTY